MHKIRGVCTVPEHHEIGFTAGSSHEVGLGQPLLVRLVARVLEQLRVLDVQPSTGLSEPKRLNIEKELIIHEYTSSKTHFYLVKERTKTKL